MKKINIILFIILLVAFSLVRAGEISKMGSTAAQFLKIGVGARASAMGEGFVAEASDASAIFWNPAGLALVNTNEAMFARTNWIADMTYDFAAVAMPFPGIGTFGLFYQALNMDEMEVRTEYQPDGTGEMFNATSFALGISFAREVTNRFSFGTSVKFIQESIWHESASTFAFDVGIIYKTSLKGLRLGMAITNYGGKMRMEGKDLLRFIDTDPNLDGNNESVISRLNTERYDIPLSFRVGLAYDPVKTELHRITATLDGVTPNDYNEYINVGLEYGFREMVFLRAGYKGVGVVETEVGFSVGGGLKYSMKGNLSLSVDYAYVDFGRLNDVQRVSLSILF